MTVKRMQNTHGKAQIEWVKNSKLFHKHNASIPPHSNFNKIKDKRNIKKLQKPNTKTNSTNTKNQNQKDIFRKIFIIVALK